MLLDVPLYTDSSIISDATRSWHMCFRAMSEFLQKLRIVTVPFLENDPLVSHQPSEVVTAFFRLPRTSSGSLHISSSALQICSSSNSTTWGYSTFTTSTKGCWPTVAMPMHWEKILVYPTKPTPPIMLQICSAKDVR